MHSSRMRTVCSSGCILGGGWGVPARGVYLVPGGVPGPRGCTWSQGVYLPRGVYLVGGGAPAQGVYLAWGVYLVLEGVYLVRYSPPCGHTHACKNITFTTSLRTVIRPPRCVHNYLN